MRTEDRRLRIEDSAESVLRVRAEIGRSSAVDATPTGLVMHWFQPGAALRFTPGCHMAAFQALRRDGAGFLEPSRLISRNLA